MPFLATRPRNPRPGRRARKQPAGRYLALFDARRRAGPGGRADPASAARQKLILLAAATGGGGALSSPRALFLLAAAVGRRLGSPLI